MRLCTRDASVFGSSSFVALSFVLASPSPAHAQFLDKVKDRAEEAAEQENRRVELVRL